MLLRSGDESLEIGPLRPLPGAHPAYRAELADICTGPGLRPAPTGNKALARR